MVGVILTWCAPADAATPEPAVDVVVAVGTAYATGEGSGVDVRPGWHGLLRGRGVAAVGAARIGADLDERTTRILASRKTVLAGAGAGPVALLSGVGLVERGLFGPNARAQPFVPLEAVVDARAGSAYVQLRARPFWIVGGPFEVAAEAAVAVGVDADGGLGPRLEVGWRQEFGHDVVLVALGAGFGPRLDP